MRVPPGFEGVVAIVALIGGLTLWLSKRRSRVASRRGLPAVSVLVVVKDQAGVVEGFLREAWRMVVTAAGERSDLVVVDDASSDETPKILEQLGRTLPALKLAHWRPGTSPGGSAVELGYFLCNQPAVLLLHLKDTERPGEFLRILELFCRPVPATMSRGSSHREGVEAR